MKFKVSTELNYDVHAESTILFNIHALKSDKQTILLESFEVDPIYEAVELNSATIENRFIRISVATPGKLKVSYQAEVESSFRIREVKEDIEVQVAGLDATIHPYLYPSRYCQSDKLFRFAQHTFGHFAGSFAKASAITRWIFTNVQYTGGFTDSQTSAYDTVTELVGVCRDFAHLGIALCRALSIPARYFTAYALYLNPGDFHACFEAYIGNEWVLFDPTFLVPLNGMVKIGSGRDAADTSIATMYGDVYFSSMKVDCKILEEGFTPLPNGLLGNQTICYS